MATRQTQQIARLMTAPSIILLFIWMIVPLAMTLYFSFRYYNLLNPAAYASYLKAGFRDTGEIFTGGSRGPQHILCADLPAPKDPICSAKSSSSCSA